VSHLRRAALAASARRTILETRERAGEHAEIRAGHHTGDRGDQSEDMRRGHSENKAEHAAQHRATERGKPGAARAGRNIAISADSEFRMLPGRIHEERAHIFAPKSMPQKSLDRCLGIALLLEATRYDIGHLHLSRVKTLLERG
jgi:hypothetical protein